jgi:O-succinylbenzoic acid--CoA ligase
MASGATISFAEIEETLHLVVANLKDAGIRKRSLVALHVPNSNLHLYIFLAAWVMDFVYIPLDFKAPLSSLLSDTEIDFLVTDAEESGMVKYSVILPEEVLANRRLADHNVNWPAIPFRQEASAIFTSGSTGKPRGIVHTVGNYIYSALGTDEFIGLNTSDRWLLSLPLFHVGGALIWVRTLLSGSACILPDSPHHLEAAIRQYRPTVISLVPAQLIRLIDNDETITILQGMKTIMLGGAPSPAWLIDKSLDLKLPIMPTYGCTESCAQVTGVPRGSSRQAYHSAGQVVPYRDLRFSENSLIELGGKTLFKRYLHDLKSNPLDQDGFFKTADSGAIDKDGNLVIHGRTDGVFISGGENISPPEIENFLLQQDGINTAMVVPVTHQEFGLTPWAFIETSLPFDEKSIRDKLRKNLPGYKLPKRIIRLSPDHLQVKMKHSREALTKLAGTLAEGKTEELKNTDLHYEEMGRTDAPVIVFLHGFMGQARSFRTIMESLADAFRLIAFDLPGHGASLFVTNNRLKQLCGMEDSARLILEDLDMLDIEQFSLYGYSMGGRIAQHIAIAAPDRVNRLILESASFGIADAHERSERLQKDQSLLSNVRTPDDFRTFLKDWYNLPLFRTLPGTTHLRTLIEDKLSHPVAEYQKALNILSVGGHSFLAGQLTNCKFPIFYFCGNEDVAYSETARQIKTLLPDMTVKIFTNASHNIHIQYPQEIISAIREILI